MEEKDEGPDFAYDNSNIFKDILMLWSFPIIKYFRKNPPNLNNPICLPNRMHYQESLKALKKAWKVEKLEKSPNLFNSLWKVLKKDFIIAALPGAICYNFLVLSAMMIVYIVNYISSNNEPVFHIVGYIIAYACILQVNSFGMTYTIHKNFLLTGKLKGLISQIIYEKTLKTFYGEISQGDQAGKFSSLISSDVEFMEGIMIMPFFLSVPIFLTGSGILL